jgi:polyhydroxybutyrate depolymerase
MRRTLLLVAAILTIAACSDSTTGSGTTVPGTTVPPTSNPVATDPPVTEPAATPPTLDPARPYNVFVPSTYAKGTPVPLVILLHGFGASGDIQEGYLQVQPLAEREGFLYAHLDGTKGIGDRQFWNATDACCGFRSIVDDVGYITAVIDDISAKYDVDPKRIYLMGHSNGGFMSYRMACELSDRIAAIASMAGATFDDPAKCAPKEPVSVLQVHGTSDGTISYTGGVTPFINGTYPSADKTVETWAGYDGCTGPRTAAGSAVDFEPNIPGAETGSTAFGGCPAGIGVELWTVNGGAHIPAILFSDGSRPLTDAMVTFLLDHPKP